MNLISRFVVVAMVLGAVFTVAGCAHTGGPTVATTTARPVVATKKACFTKPPYYSHVVGRFACDDAKIALVANMFQEAQDFGACDPESGDAFWRFLGALKIYRTCATSVRFPPELSRNLMEVARAFLADIEVGFGVGRDCSQELQVFREAMQAPQSPQ